ncbi:MAG: cytochrome o ubiquinol oxidase subunit I, partial [Achromobacter pestifer]
AKYDPIHMPRNTAVGFVISMWGLLLCFALVWHMWAVAAGSLIAIVVTFVVRSYDRDVDFYIPAAEVERIENARYDRLQEAA